MRFISEHKSRLGAEPIYRVLTQHGCPIAPSMYNDAGPGPLSARARRDELLKAAISRVHRDNYGVYGAHKVWLELNREGTQVARCTVERQMRELSLRGARRGKKVRTTVPDPAAPRPADLLQRQFSPPAPGGSMTRGQNASVRGSLSSIGIFAASVVMSLRSWPVMGVPASAR